MANTSPHWGASFILKLEIHENLPFLRPTLPIHTKRERKQKQKQIKEQARNIEEMTNVLLSLLFSLGVNGPLKQT